MKIENPVAFSFIMPDDLYLLNKDKTIATATAGTAATATAGTTATATAPATSAPMIETPPLNFNFMGGNKKNLLVITHYHELEFISESHLTALENILKRLEFSLDDAAIFNIAKHIDVNHQQVLDFFKPQKLLLLGENALPAGIGKLTLNQPQQFNNCNTLFSFSFDEMMDSNENKKAFWEQMKKL
jgi:hypothetical protein